jgi:hypothetical protein
MKMRLIASVQKMIFISVFLFSACGSEKKQANLPDPKDSTANANLAREISKEIENDPTNTEGLKFTSIANTFLEPRQICKQS